MPFLTCPCMVSWMRDNDYQTHWQRLLLWFQTPFNYSVLFFIFVSFMLKCQGGGVWWGTECACLWLNVVETPPPLTDGWLLPVCITYPALILLPIKGNSKGKKRMLICIHLFVHLCNSYIAFSVRRCNQMEKTFSSIFQRCLLSFPTSSKPT